MGTNKYKLKDCPKSVILVWEIVDVLSLLASGETGVRACSPPGLFGNQA